MGDFALNVHVRLPGFIIGVVPWSLLITKLMLMVVTDYYIYIYTYLWFVYKSVITTTIITTTTTTTTVMYINLIICSQDHGLVIWIDSEQRKG